MKRIHSLSIPLLVTFALPISLNAAEINCNSPVWKNKAVCNKKKAKLKEPKFCKNEDLSITQKKRESGKIYIIICFLRVGATGFEPVT